MQSERLRKEREWWPLLADMASKQSMTKERDDKGPTTIFEDKDKE